MFVDHLDDHLRKIIECFEAIKNLFTEFPDFSQLPAEEDARIEFAKQFSQLYKHMQAARVQGFTWSKDTYHINGSEISVEITEPGYIALISRYKELNDGNSGGAESSASFGINAHITHIDTDRIDDDCLNSKYTKYL